MVQSARSAERLQATAMTPRTMALEVAELSAWWLQSLTATDSWTHEVESPGIRITLLGIVAPQCMQERAELELTARIAMHLGSLRMQALRREDRRCLSSRLSFPAWTSPQQRELQ